MKNKLLLICALITWIGFTRMKTGSIPQTIKTTLAEPSYVYRFKDRLLDIYGLSMRDTTPTKDLIEIKRENFHAAFFGYGTSYKAKYRNKIFELKENRDISITANGKQVKIISDPDKKISTDNISGNAGIFSVPSGVICFIRLNGENGYHIKKYDENGKLLNTWKIAHTQYKKYDNVVESIPYLYYFAHSNKEMIFSSLSHSGPNETIVLNIIEGTMEKSGKPTGGIILDPKDSSLSGTVNFIDDKKKMEINCKGKSWRMENESYDDGAKTILKDSLLVIASYCNIATGCTVNAYHVNTGKLIWKGDVKQLMVGHSKYFNTVHLTLFDGRLILEGNEAYGDYLQVLDLKSGKNLFSLMPGTN